MSNTASSATDDDDISCSYMRGEVMLSVTKVPRRKHIALTVTVGNVIYTMAYCRNKKEAMRLVKTLNYMLVGIGGPEHIHDNYDN